MTLSSDDEACSACRNKKSTRKKKLETRVYFKRGMVFIFPFSDFCTFISNDFKVFI